MFQHKKRHVIFIIICLLFSKLARSSEYQHELLNENQGFPTSIIFSIVQDKHGFLWFGTAFDGLLRYDGKNVVSYRNEPSELTSLPHNNAGNLLFDSNDNLWVGSWGGGVIHYEYEEQLFTQYTHSNSDPNSIGALRVQSILEAEDGTLWFGTFSSGLNQYVISENRFIRYPFIRTYEQNSQSYTRALQSDRVWDIAQIDNEGIWLATNNGLSFFDFQKKQFYQYRPFNTSQQENINQIRQIYAGEESVLYLATSNGVMVFNTETHTFITLPFKNQEISQIGPIHSIIKTKENEYWVTSALGVFSFTDDALQLNKVPLTFDDSCSQTLFQDKQGTIWLSCEGMGIYKITKNNIFKSLEIAELNPAMILKHSIDDSILIGTAQNGLKKWNPQTNLITTINKSPVKGPQEEIRFITETSSGEIWVANRLTLHKLDQNGAKIVFKPEPRHLSVFNDIRHINVDNEGYIWALVPEGAFRIHTSMEAYDFYEKTKLQHSNAVTEGPTYTIVDSKEKFWLITEKTIARFNATSKSFDKVYSMGDNNVPNELYNYVYFAYVGDKDNVWIADLNGLYVVDLNTGKRELISNYFDETFNRGVRFITPDTANNLWLVTPIGISRLNINSGQLDHFDNRDGLPSARFFYSPTSNVDEGIIYLSTRDNIVYFNTTDLIAPRSDEPIRLTNFEVLGHAQSFTENKLMHEGITLDSDQVNVKFDFATLDILNARQIIYSYKLEGFDSKWVDNGLLGSVTYTNLSGGNYVFKVRAKIKEDQWFENELAIPVTIATPIWLQGWMIGIYVLILLCIVYYYVKRQQNALFRLEKLVSEKTADIELESRKLASANRFKTRFLANMSHEIRTPLTTVIGQAEAIICNDVEPEDIKQEVEIIHDSSIYLLTLLNDILDLTKIEENKFQLDFRPTDLHSLLNTINTMFSMQAKVKGLEFLLEESLPEPFIASVDGLRLKQILINLLSNALKFTLKGRVELSVKIQDEQLIFSVKDSGIGISEEQLKQIFDSFTQGDASIRRRFGGSGIGLHLSNQLAVLMSGRIDVQSRLGEGSVFSFSMPIPELIISLDTSNSRLTNTPFNKESVFSGTLLLAEDHDENRRLISRLLSALGFKVFAAVDGFDALDQYKAYKPDAVLLDIQMPKKDGIQTFKDLRKIGCNKPIIALTANALANEVEEYFEIGFDGYVQKPINRQSLISTLAKFFDYQEVTQGNNEKALLENVNMSDLIEEFILKLPNEWAELAAHKEESDLEAIQARAHRIAGAAQLFGFKDLSEHSTVLERKIKSGCTTLNDIHEELEILKKTIDKHTNIKYVD